MKKPSERYATSELDKPLLDLYKEAILIALNEYSNGNFGVPVKISKIAKRANRILSLLVIKRLEKEGFIKVEGNTVKRLKNDMQK